MQIKTNSKRQKTCLVAKH